MCRNIKALYNFDPPATEEEIRASAVQYVRKVSGFNKPSTANAEAFERAVDAVTEASTVLLGELTTSAPPKDREAEAAKKGARSEHRRAAEPLAHAELDRGRRGQEHRQAGPRVPRGSPLLPED